MSEQEKCPKCGAPMIIENVACQTNYNTYRTGNAGHKIDGEFCLSKQVEQLKAEHEKLREKLPITKDGIAVGCGDCLFWDNGNGKIIGHSIEGLSCHCGWCSQEAAKCYSTLEAAQRKEKK